ncbi:hypothetical protein ACOMD4_30535 [Streptomyces anulatus]|uniref:hypothetical protein n=1 Tax=Streptomyces anulatus TaxID=1892 RepID=UPI003B769120
MCLHRIDLHPGGVQHGPAGRLQHADDSSCSGRGLFLVGELAADFGIDHHVVGKTVWAAFERPATP